MTTDAAPCAGLRTPRLTERRHIDLLRVVTAACPA
ncbi:hypothetical protein SAMN05443575_2373 [Jatrophihabitans endophyticus]|uniref:Uncharacterized protein n=1 Tax=Jatrophihabitans endophyticus TaxID=1206085 RepID=A0A1M5L778_9ACTN|nr:hypothetical protein SAMN05443575_2373 [Jatrophihabitans endophyticus]